MISIFFDFSKSWLSKYKDQKEEAMRVRKTIPHFRKRYDTCDT